MRCFRSHRCWSSLISSVQSSRKYFIYFLLVFIYSICVNGIQNDRLLSATCTSFLYSRSVILFMPVENESPFFNTKTTTIQIHTHTLNAAHVSAYSHIYLCCTIWHSLNTHRTHIQTEISKNVSKIYTILIPADRFFGSSLLSLQW